MSHTLIWHMGLCIFIAHKQMHKRLVNMQSVFAAFCSDELKYPTVCDLKQVHNDDTARNVRILHISLGSSKFVTMASPIQICWASKVLQLLLDGRGKSDEAGLTTLGPVPHKMRVNWLKTPKSEREVGNIINLSPLYKELAEKAAKLHGGGRKKKKQCSPISRQQRRDVLSVSRPWLPKSKQQHRKSRGHHCPPHHCNKNRKTNHYLPKTASQKLQSLNSDQTLLPKQYKRKKETEQEDIIYPLWLLDNKKTWVDEGNISSLCLWMQVCDEDN